MIRKQGTRIWKRGVVALTLAGALMIVGDVLAGGSPKTVVKDGPSTTIEPGCDIRKATSKLTDDGRLRHTVTLAEGTSITVHSVAITGNRGGRTDLVLKRGANGVESRLSDQGRTVVLIVRRGRVVRAVDSRDRYFWQARSCRPSGDRAPNGGTTARQPL